MANLLQALNSYGPKLELKTTAQLNRVAEWMVMRTGLNKSEVMMMLVEMSEALLNFNKDGVPVKLPGICTFTPTIGRDGVFNISFRAVVELKKRMNDRNLYQGEINNRPHIGIANEELKELWDADHPNDPLTI
ncbi:MAG: hypothetical protein NT121_25075 [Chloroflexi bacterium]|nr:hypothetical protein [Chloroflexota bacterium]